MPEHRIRLRGAWDWSRDGDQGQPTRKVDLPLTTQGDLPRRSRLTRKFGRPPYDRATESLRLELADVPGLLRVALNGAALIDPPSTGEVRSIPLVAPLPARNTLTLDVDFDPAAFERAWGSIALVVEAKGDRDGPSRYNGGPSGSDGRGIVEAG